MDNTEESFVILYYNNNNNNNNFIIIIIIISDTMCLITVLSFIADINGTLSSKLATHLLCLHVLTTMNSKSGFHAS